MGPYRRTQPPACVKAWAPLCQCLRSLTSCPALPCHAGGCAARCRWALPLGVSGEEFLYCVKAAGFASGRAASGRACGLRPVPPYAVRTSNDHGECRCSPGRPTSACRAFMHQRASWTCLAASACQLWRPHIVAGISRTAPHRRPWLGRVLSPRRGRSRDACSPEMILVAPALLALVDQQAPRNLRHRRHQSPGAADSGASAPVGHLVEPLRTVHDHVPTDNGKRHWLGCDSKAWNSPLRGAGLTQTDPGRRVCQPTPTVPPLSVAMGVAPLRRQVWGRMSGSIWPDTSGGPTPALWARRRGTRCRCVLLE